MRKNYILVFLLSLIVVGCYKDEGSYDYTVAEEINLTQFFVDVDMASGMFRIDYVFDPEIPEEYLEKYDFWWEKVTRTSDNFICDGPVLNFAPDEPGDMYVYLVARDKVVGVETEGPRQTISVDMSFGEGWLIQHETEGSSALTFVLPGNNEEYTYAPCFLEDLGPNPKGVYCYFDNYDYKIWNHTDSAAAFDIETYQMNVELKNNIIGGVPSDYEFKEMANSSYAELLLSTNGNLYVKCYNEGYYTDKYFSRPIMEDNESLHVENIWATDYASSIYLPIIVNRDGVRSLECLGTGSPAQYDFACCLDETYYYDLSGTTTSPAEGGIDVKNLGDCRYINSYYNLTSSNYHGIFENNGKYVRLEVKRSSTIVSYYPWVIAYKICVVESEVNIAAGMSDDAEIYHIGADASFFITNENNLYYYDSIRDETKLYYSFTAGTKIVDCDINGSHDEVGVLLDSGEFTIMKFDYSVIPATSSSILYNVTCEGKGASVLYKYRDYMSNYYGQKGTL